MRIHLPAPHHLAEAVGEACAAFLIIAMLALAVAEAVWPIARLLTP